MRGRVSEPGRDRDARKDYWGVVLDSRTPHELARFYATLLGWEVAIDDDSYATVLPPDGVTYLGFHLNDHHVRPVWPSDPEHPQQQLHLDFEVQDLAQAVAHAVELGATIAVAQPQENVRVLLDPDGHPFCLYT